MPRKVWIALTIETFVFAILLFGSAGRLNWAAGWAFMILFLGSLWLLVLRLARRDPALLAERMKMKAQPGQPLWDRILLQTIIILWFAWFVLAALDGGRFHWSKAPVWLQWLGGAAVPFAVWIFDWTFKENTFSAPVVRIQKERGHKVISSGPYAIVRHPLYAGALLLMPATALLLGSWYGVLGSMVVAACLVIRTIMEEKTLIQKLEGYPEYAQRVHYRLIPFIW